MNFLLNYVNSLITALVSINNKTDILTLREKDYIYMDILNKPIGEMSFDDIVDFCKLKVIEGVTIEYKSDFPKDLSKQFVTFSNTQGGLIIIGVSENAKTGLPEKWEGIDADVVTKPIDRVYQAASNVIPFPSFEVRTTNESNGKVFVLIRVLEGAAPPYATNSDPTPWVRTGNISTPIIPANREGLLQLISKRNRAQQVREASVDFAHLTLELDLTEAEKERESLLSNPNTNETIYTHPLGTGEGAAVFSIAVMPFYPMQPLMKYGKLLSLNVFLGDAWQGTAFIHGTKSIPGGLAAFTWSHHSGHITSNQIYLNGATYMAFDVLQVKDDIRQISAYNIGHVIHKELMIAKKVFEQTAYNGQISIYSSLHGGMGALTLPPADQFWNDTSGILNYEEYKWSEDTDSSVFMDSKRLADLHLKMFKRICWDIGLNEVPDHTIRKFFEDNNWYK